MEATRSEILNWRNEKPTMARTISAASKLDRLGGDVSVRFAIVRNITLEPGLPAALKVSAAKRNVHAVVELGNFDAVQDEVCDADSVVYRNKPDVIVIALHLQTIMPKLVLQFSSLSPADVAGLCAGLVDRVAGLVARIREQSSALILVHNFEIPAVSCAGILEAQLEHSQRATIRALNADLARTVASLQASYVVDIDYLQSQLGYASALDERYWHIGRAPYSYAFIERLAEEYATFGAALKGKAKKCLVLDCDNTLWGGVVGEDGLNGIALSESHPGSAFVEFHAAILNLYERGVLIALNSKNNETDAMEVFEKHPSSLLRPQHFVATKINWRDKASNLREIAAELNIGLDSLVFMDDSAFECRHVREQLPEVTVVELPPDPSRYARILRGLNAFDTLSVSDEDRRRTQMYRSNIERTQLRNASGTMDDYLRSLRMTLTISRANAFSVPRIAQLTQKTNQFNLTTRRYSEGDISRMADDRSWRVYFAELEDSFDRAGIIAVALVHDTGDVARIDSFLMSCRVIGRGIENGLLAHIARESKEGGQRQLVGEYIATSKNELASGFLAQAGFASDDPAAGGFWRLDLGATLPAVPDWFANVHVSQQMANA